MFRVLFLILAVLLAQPSVNYGEVAAPDSARPPRKLTEKEERELEEFRKDVEILQKSQEEALREEEQRQAVEPLVDQIFSLVKGEKYPEAKQAIAEWQSVYPQDFRISLMWNLISKLERENDPVRKHEFMMEFTRSLLEKSKQ